MSDLTLSHSVSDDSATINITARGKLTIDHASELLELLRENRSFKTTRIDLSAVTDIDLSGIQSICSACRTTLSNSGNFHISGHFPPLLVKLLEDAGLKSQTTCRHKTEIQCIWNEGAN